MPSRLGVDAPRVTNASIELADATSSAQSSGCFSLAQMALKEWIHSTQLKDSPWIKQLSQREVGEDSPSAHKALKMFWNVLASAPTNGWSHGV